MNFQSWGAWQVIVFIIVAVVLVWAVTQILPMFL